MASCHSLVMVEGGARANNRIMKKTTQHTPVIPMTDQKMNQFCPGGGRARGPWGPNAIQYARFTKSLSVFPSSTGGREESLKSHSRLGFLLGKIQEQNFTSVEKW